MAHLQAGFSDRITAIFYYPWDGLSEIDFYREYIISKRSKHVQINSFEFALGFILESVNVVPSEMYLLFVQMSPTLKYLCLQIRALVGQMVQVDETDLVYKGPWVRSAQQRLFQTLETDYAFPRATCRSLVNLIWDFLNETFSEKLHEGQITFHAASASEPPGKRLSQIKSVPVHLTVHDRNDMDILTKEGTSGLRKHKILRMASEALDQDGLLTQEDLAVLLCSSRRTIRRDIKELKQQGIDVPTVARFKISAQE